MGDYLGLTKDNVSQRLKTLGQLGLLRRLPDLDDKRVVHLLVTAAGIKVLDKCYPPPSWKAAVKASRATDLLALEQRLTHLLVPLLGQSDGRTFGRCATCRFHSRDKSGAACRLLQVPLDRSRWDRICREHQPLTTP